MEDIMIKLSYENDKILLNEIAFVCSNASSFAQCAYAICKTSIPKMFVDIFKETSSKSLKVEILDCFQSMVSHKNPDITGELLLLPILELFISNTDTKMDVEILSICLKGLYYFLFYGELTKLKNNIIAFEIEGAGALQVIDELVDHNMPSISDLCKLIKFEFFTQDEETYKSEGLF